MPFNSILFEIAEDRLPEDTLEQPSYFVDLNCDQIVAAITKDKDEYNLKPFFHQRLRRIDAILYRHEVMQDLEYTPLLQRIKSFCGKMSEIRQNLARVEKLYYREQQQAWFLDAVEAYCRAVQTLADDLAEQELISRGFTGLREYIIEYSRSPHFTDLLADTKGLQAELATIRYSVLIKGPSFTVRAYEGEADYSSEVLETFDKFKQGAAKDYRVKFTENADMNHIEAKIIEFVAKLYPEIFGALSAYCAKHADFIDRTMAAFDREVQFYIAYLDYIDPLRKAGLRFCYPGVTDATKEVYDYDGFDIALAHKLVSASSSVVCNAFHLTGKERVLVVSGPNQGGKTTFARTFGQLHYLANIGCPVPGSEAQLFLFDKLFTHFEKQEKVENLRGKLEDDLMRIHQILSEATPESIVIMNEIFNSTTIQDETFLSRKVMERIVELDLLAVLVTFVDELATFSPQTVSMVSTVVPENPALRTFKVVRRPADGLAYANAIAQKYGLTYDAIMQRVTP